MIATNRAVDLIEEEVDVAIRARTRLNDELLTMRRLGTSDLIFVASPGFVEAHAADPADLTEHPFLSFQEETAAPSWKLMGPGEITQVVAFEPVLWTIDLNILVETASAGRGIVPCCQPKLPIGRLAKDD